MWWIRHILESTRISVLKNGSPTKEFGMSRGLRQGYPMSPMLFNIVGEVLHLLLEKAMELGFFKGLALGKGPVISHNQYADDTILVFDESILSCQGMKVILLLFRILSGLKINFNKSTLYSSDPNGDLSTQCANILGCNSSTWPFSYVGYQVGASPHRKQFWKPIRK